ncbi:sigma-70 family RNA polymerase sigma factor [Aquibacillus rhizosphaerae]|uniref:Sigma-70 family RNA polymerase sigma factor n=1 Tax=Aquibacillus rhizosphaerae TaxID=3051431 RepID=A0ABT7L1N9_9BACI|nr:sigma-70 family RNA polymerase sigma factor [Aquibacillus sp. LR5S19]MDL4839107.1 sigma-70 family RNA polymerase sigma factor [Aquibacillus sp. LR5S19]
MVEKISDFEEIVKQHENMIHHLIHKCGIRDYNQEFYQEGMIALWKAAKTYDESRGKFSSYAYFLIEKGLLSLIRSQNHQVEKQEACVSGLSMERARMSDSFEIGFDPYLLHMIEENLTENQMKWFTMFVLNDRPIKEIAATLNVTEDAVKNWARHAKPKIRKLLQM